MRLEYHSDRFSSALAGGECLLIPDSIRTAALPVRKMFSLIIAVAVTTASVGVAQQRQPSSVESTKLPAMVERKSDTPHVPGTPPRNAGKDCMDGARKALEAALIVTVVGCTLDLFLSGGTLCTSYLSTAGAKAFTIATVGCAIGAAGSPTAAASTGATAITVAQ